MTVTYDGANAPTGASLVSLTTSLGIANPEGVIVLPTASAFGNAGDLYVAEDQIGGRILRVEPGSGTTTELVGGLSRPEGMDFGDFAGQVAAALYTAETVDHNVLRIDSNGAVSVVGIPAAVGLTAPDNVKFGPDGFLYVSEDRPQPDSRIIRIAADGTHSVFATGFGQAEGMAIYICTMVLTLCWPVTAKRACD